MLLTKPFICPCRFHEAVGKVLYNALEYGNLKDVVYTTCLHLQLFSMASSTICKNERRLSNLTLLKTRNQWILAQHSKSPHQSIARDFTMPQMNKYSDEKL